MRLIILLLFPIISFSQKITSDKIDDFTGNRIVLSSAESIGDALVIGGVQISKGDTVFVFSIAATTPLTTSVTKDSKIHLKFESGDIVVLPSTGGYEIVYKGSYAGMQVRMNDEVIKKLLHSERVVKLRVETTETNIDVDTGKKAGKLNDLMKLLAERVSYRA